MTTDPTALRLGNVTLDCASPLAVAAFWSAALGRPVDEGASDGFASIGGNDDGQVGWFFIHVPEEKAVKNRMHVDLHADDREAAVQRLIGLGAERVGDFDEFGTRWTTMRDVERNEFDVA